MNYVKKGVIARAHRPLAAAAVAGLAGLSLHTAAQAADVADAAAAEAGRGHTVDGVDVEGHESRRPQSPKYTAALIDTPRSVTVIPQRIIEQTAATSLQDILRTSPGITFGAGEGGQPLADRPFIRGQASGNNIFVDGVRDTGGQMREVFNLEQVEVIKGADSAYSGRGSGGGSINLTSKRPKLDNFVNASARAGTSDFLRGTIDANYQVGESAAVRFNFMGTRGDTPKRDGVDFERWGLALGAAYGLDTSTRATLLYYHFESDDMPDYGVPLYTKLPNTPRPNPSGVLNVDRDTFYGLKARDFQKTKADIFTFVAEHEVSEALTFRNAFRYSKTLNDYLVTNPGDGGAAQFVAGEWWMKRGTKSRWNPTTTIGNVTDIYGKFNTGGIGHSYAGGLELSQEDNKNASYVIYTTAGAACPTGFANPNTAAGVADCTLVYAPNPNDPWQGIVNRPTPSTNTAKTTGVYLFDTLSFGDQWLLNLGVRHDRYSVRGIDNTITSANGVVTNVVGTNRKGEWSFTNYQAGLVFKPTQNGSVYVSYGTSSTPPTIASGDQNAGSGLGTGNLANVLLEPEEVESYEAGVKWAFFRERLSASAAYFDLTRKNAQVQIANGVYAQVGEARIKGVELAVTGQVARGWMVFGGYTYQDSELVSGAYNSVNIGDPLANSPKHNFSLFTTYELPNGFSFGGGAYYVSRSFGGNQGGAGGGTNSVYAPSYWRFDAYAAYKIRENIDIQLNVQNVGDKAYIARTNGVHHADYGPARQAILTLNVRY